MTDPVPLEQWRWYDPMTNADRQRLRQECINAERIEPDEILSDSQLFARWLRA